MRQKLETIGLLLDRCLKRSDSGLPTVILQLYESNEPVRLIADVMSHSGECMVLHVGRSVNNGQRVSILITCCTDEHETGIDKEVRIEATGKITGSTPSDRDVDQFEVSVQLKGRYGVVFENESSRR